VTTQEAVRPSRLRALIGITVAAVSFGIPAAATAAGATTPAPTPVTQANNASVTITGGNATAVAACVNAGKSRSGNVTQRNHCKNVAVARGGNVILNHVDIIVSQTNTATGATTTSRVNNATVSISGGDATALAACVNLAYSGYGSVSQQNACRNTAIARGGNVKLNHVNIYVIQTNG
jgi:hypothetical protein